MPAGRPHEAAGNVSPRWMTAAPRKRSTEPGLQADSPPFILLTCIGVAALAASSAGARRALVPGLSVRRSVAPFSVFVGRLGGMSSACFLPSRPPAWSLPCGPLACLYGPLNRDRPAAGLAPGRAWSSRSNDWRFSAQSSK